ncbi:MAG: hypothetical protein ABWX67_16005 [Allosphingosinicella sp.]
MRLLLPAEAAKGGGEQPQTVAIAGVPAEDLASLLFGGRGIGSQEPAAIVQRGLEAS